MSWFPLRESSSGSFSLSQQQDTFGPRKNQELPRGVGLIWPGKPAYYLQAEDVRTALAVLHHFCLGGLTDSGWQSELTIPYLGISQVRFRQTENDHIDKFDRTISWKPTEREESSYRPPVVPFERIVFEKQKQQNISESPLFPWSVVSGG